MYKIEVRDANAQWVTIPNVTVRTPKLAQDYLVKLPASNPYKQFSVNGWRTKRA